MEWSKWRPWYEWITTRLGLDPTRDFEAAKLLNENLPRPRLSALKKLIRGRECLILGAGPSLERDLEKLEKFGYLRENTLICADGATSGLLRFRVPHIIVTDLDGNVPDQIEAWRKGAWMIVHGHGDNVKTIREILPRLRERVIGTTQTKPFGKLFNFGGFTDGDRAAFMAYELGAFKIHLAGMDLGTKIGKYSGRKNVHKKRIKLKICKELLGWLSKLGAPLINLTSSGEDIPQVPRKPISYKKEETEPTKR